MINKAGTPTTQAVAEAIERLRDALFREYGADYQFTVVAKDVGVLGSYLGPDHVIHACVRK